MLVQRAILFATEAHQGQTRKYTGEPYIVHPLEVMEIVKTVPHTPEMLAAAVLHDVVEDTDVTLSDIWNEFGYKVRQLVADLTDVSVPSDGNRKARKHLDLIHTAKALPQSKTVKLADLISNSKSITEHDPKFAKVYMKEKAALLKVLTEGDPTLYARAKKIVDDYYSI
jgi:(p)ppGpp synthase/HD superfamily hydrolase